MNSYRDTQTRFRGGIAAWTLACLLSTALAACGGGGGGGSAAGPVQVVTIDPPTGPFIGGTPVTIRGSGFALPTPNVVLFGSAAATNVVAVDAQTITCVSPAGAPGARVDVVVRNDQGEGRLPLGFAYAIPSPPTSDVNGDGLGDLLVASPADPTSGAGAGAVFVFFGRAQPFQLDGLDASQADVKLVGHRPGDAFGTCVCAGDMDGDGQADLIVSANKFDAVGAADAGAVYVFPGPIAGGQTIPAQAATIRLVGDAAVAGDEFGSSVDIGDVDGDGRADLLSSAPKHDVAEQIDAGCVYVFLGSPTLASRSADLADHFVDGVSAGDRLGSRIACGDLDGDGQTDLVLGAASADVVTDVLLFDAGRVYVLSGGSSFIANAAQARVVIDGAADGDRLGEAVTVADLDGDGQLDLVVSAPYQDSGEVDSGRVYVFRGGLGLVSGTADSATLMLTGIPNSGPIGLSLRAGDVDGDSIADLVIGAPEANALGTRDGLAYLFRGGPGLTSSSVASADAVVYGDGQLLEGFSAAISLIDIDGDGFADLAGASPRWSGLGRVHLWRGGVGSIEGPKHTIDADVELSGTELGGRFGESLAPGQ